MFMGQPKEIAEAPPRMFLHSAEQNVSIPFENFSPMDESCFPGQLWRPHMMQAVVTAEQLFGADQVPVKSGVRSSDSEDIAAAGDADAAEVLPGTQLTEAQLGHALGWSLRIENGNRHMPLGSILHALPDAQPQKNALESQLIIVSRLLNGSHLFFGESAVT